MGETIYDFQFQRGTAARWTQLNPALRSGEPGFEIDTGLFKIGDGSTEWNDLEYYLTEEYITALIEVQLAETGGLSSDPRIGDLEDLTTTVKDFIVNAINEVNAKTAQITTLQAEHDALEVVVAGIPRYVEFGRQGLLAPFIGPKIYFTDDVELVASTISLTLPPSGSSAIFEILKNGSAVHSSSPAIPPSGSLASAGTLAGPTIYQARQDYLQFQCLQAGSGNPGSELAVSLKLIPA